MTTTKLKILLSAYSCEPFKGSEPEVGWQWALQMARFHDVTVLTRTNNRENIERGLALLPPGTPVPRFVFFDLGWFFLWLKRKSKMHRLYYIVWQKSAYHVIEELHHIFRFDLLHHITIAGFRYTTAIWGHDIPCIWGPIGGMEAMPLDLLPKNSLATWSFELLRRANNALQSMPFHVIPSRAASSSAILVSTHETACAFENLGIETQLFPTIGMEKSSISDHPISQAEGPLKLLFVGSIIAIKGVELAILALAQARSDATLTIIGDGNYLKAAQNLVEKLNLTGRVHFLGRKPRLEILTIYPSCHVFLFPSLHDSGGFVALEAMSQGLPVVCLDCGGPALSVKSDFGIRVPMGKRSNVINGLASAIDFYDQHREKIREHGELARHSLHQNYEWNAKGEKMNQIYETTLKQHAPQKALSASPRAFSGLVLKGHIFSKSGIFVILFSFIFVVFIQLYTLQTLKIHATAISNDTMPELVYAGAANEAKSKSFIYTMLLTHADPDQNAGYLRQMDEYTNESSRNLQAYHSVIHDAEDVKALKILQKVRAEYLISRSLLQQYVQSGNQEEAYRFLVNKLIPSYEKYNQASQTLLTYNIQKSKEQSIGLIKVYRVIAMTLAFEAIGTFLIGFSLGFFKK